MKKTLLTLLLFILTFSLASCISTDIFNKGEDDDGGDDNVDGTKPGSDFKMTAVITELADKIAIDVIESEYTSGIHWVIIADATEFYAKDGSRITRGDLKVGDTVEILYSGQVMMSYPPQIVAARFTVK